MKKVQKIFFAVVISAFILGSVGFLQLESAQAYQYFTVQQANLSSPKLVKEDQLQFENKVIELTNYERLKHGLKPFILNVDLAHVARVKSHDMLSVNYFDHTSPTYGSPFEMMTSFGIDYAYAGENIAAGQRTPEEVVQAWLNSPGHRANILNPNYTEIGIGLATGGSYRYYWTQLFIGMNSDRSGNFKW